MARQRFPIGDPYHILKVNRKATFQEIKRSYTRLVFKYHPDKAGNITENNEKFAKVREAYEILSDPDKRLDYDRYMNEEPRWTIVHFSEIEAKAKIWLTETVLLQDRISNALQLYSQSPSVYVETIYDTLLQYPPLVIRHFRSAVFGFKDGLSKRAANETKMLTKGYLHLSLVMTQIEMLSTDLIVIIEELVGGAEDVKTVVSALVDTVRSWLNLLVVISPNTFQEVQGK